MRAISKQEIIEAQKIWANGVIAIGKAYVEKQDYVKLTEDHVDKLYFFQNGEVLFKPTKAIKEQFRTTREKALSYFSACNGACSEDLGFALQPWTEIVFENAAMTTLGDMALAMGNYFLTDSNGTQIKVEYTFGYIRDDKDQLRIVLHHSSIPFQG